MDTSVYTVSGNESHRHSVNEDEVLRYAGARTSLTLCSSLEPRGNPSIRVIHPALQPLRVFVLSSERDPGTVFSYLDVYDSSVDRFPVQLAVLAEGSIVSVVIGNGSLNERRNGKQRIKNNGEG